MTDSNNSNDDSFIDPSNLKGDRGEPIDPAELIETIKNSEGVRWPGAIFLMLLTLAVGFGLALLLFFRPSADTTVRDDTGGIGEIINIPGIDTSEIDPPEIEVPEIQPPIIVEEENAIQTIPLFGQQLISPDGTFTEWYVRPEDAEIDVYPRFVDLAWHAGTERIYMVARDKNIYWVDSSRTQIEFMDVSLQIGESLPFLEAVTAIDQDRILLLMDNRETPFVIYNLKSNRVENRFGTESETGELGTYYQIQDVKTSSNGTIYVHNRFKQNDEWTDQMQVFSSEGESILMFPLAEQFADSFAIGPEGTIFVMGGYRELQEYDLDGDVLEVIERDTFQFAEDMMFDRDGNLFFVRAFDAWLVEFEQSGQFGRIYGPAHDFDSETWALGQVTNPQSLIALPSGEFVILDGFTFQRLFLFEPAE